jgi:SH3-like domain-containing protein
MMTGFLERITMKNFNAVGLVLFILGSVAVTASAQIMAKVKTDRVNLRAKANIESETVAQVAADQMLTVRTVEDAWVQVVPPSSTDFWVHKEFVAEDTVLVNRLNARSGAGINYNVVGSFSKGDKVERRGSFGEWLKVGAPSDASLWVSRDLVEIIDPNAVVPPPETAPAALGPVGEEEALGPITEMAEPVIAPRLFDDQSTRNANMIPSATPPSAPTDLNIIPLDGQGRETVREGQLKRSPTILFKAPGSHRLVRREGNKIITTAYLRGNVNQLEGLLGEHLVIRGKEYWVEKIRVPVIVIEAIEKRSFY